VQCVRECAYRAPARWCHERACELIIKCSASANAPTERQRGGVMSDLREPDLPRTMKQRDGRALRPGWTTGSCATAAAKAAVLALATGDPQHEVEIALPGKDGEWAQRVRFVVERC